MARKVVRYRHQGELGWGIVDAHGVRPLATAYTSTRELLEHGEAELRAVASDAPTLRERELELLSPITENQQLIFQATNYRDHKREAGLDPDSAGPNIVFRKASSAICGARSDVVRPARVLLLDYELELGLVIGRSITGPIGRPSELADFLAGVVMLNDLSARDIQVPEGQFFKGKSFRTFCPIGPYLCLLDAHELARLGELRLTLFVNGEKRQDALASEMIHKPADTIAELAEVMDMFAGDLIATGTPAGVALRAPRQPLRTLASLLPEHVKWKLFIEGQQKSPRYLKAGDLIEARIRDDQGRLDLGLQQNRVVVG